MFGMEQMVANMLGLTPDGLQTMVTDFQNTIADTRQRLIDIQNTNERILEQQTAILAAIGASADDCNNDSGGDAPSGGGFARALAAAIDPAASLAD